MTKVNSMVAEVKAVGSNYCYGVQSIASVLFGVLKVTAFVSAGTLVILLIR